MPKFYPLNFENKTLVKNATQMWQFLMDKFNNPMGVAGILGNIRAEAGENLLSICEQSYRISDIEGQQAYTDRVNSGIISKYTFCHNSSGYGLAQWTYWSRKENLYNRMLELTSPFNIGDFKGQLIFMCEEMEGYNGCTSYIKNANSPEDAANYIMNNYEKPAWRGDHRARWAREFYNYFAGMNYTPIIETIGGQDNISYVVNSEDDVLLSGNYFVSFTDKTIDGDVIKNYLVTLPYDLQIGKSITFDFYTESYDIKYEDSIFHNELIILPSVEGYTEIKPNNSYGQIETGFIGNLISNAIQYQLRTVNYKSVEDIPKWFQNCFVQLGDADIIDKNNMSFSNDEMRELIWLQNSLIRHGDIKNLSNKTFNYEV